ncbi:hypothetical protein [Pseudomonas sp. RL_5y_Pfl2_73]|uniref:hypothetical protein n=1 Tax=Pseudomonas sp. RL_5y_Pfl2_73 TaxID=3088713 RepID=UPI0030DA1D50
MIGIQGYLGEEWEACCLCRSQAKHPIPGAREQARAGSVGADERSEAAIFPRPIESGAKDQKIAGFASAYRAQHIPLPQKQRWRVVELTDIKAILPPFFCPQISRTLPAGNFIAGLKYMTQPLD